MRRVTIGFALLLLAVGAVAFAEDGVRVGGRVLVPGGTPLAGASVSLLPLSPPLLRFAAEMAGDEETPVAVARTGDDGRFELLAPRAGLWRVRVETLGFVPFEIDLRPLIDPTELTDLELQTDIGTVVRAVDPAGRPVRGALVVLRQKDGRGPLGRSEWGIPARIERTLEDGTVRLARGERERSTLTVGAPGFAVREIRGVHGTAAKVRLEEGTPVRLRLMSTDGGAVAGALVALGERPHPIGVTDSEGRLQVPASIGRPPRLSLLAPDRRRLETRLDPGRADEDGTVALILPDRLLLAGRVIDADSRRPVAGGLVWDSLDPIEAATTDAAGEFVLGGPAGHRMSVTAAAAGYLGSEPIEQQLLDDGRPGPALVLEPAAAIEGRILDAGGEPVSGTEVRLQVRRAPGGFRIEIGGPSNERRVLSGEEGRYRIYQVDPEERYRLEARADGYASAGLDVPQLVPYRTKTGLDVTLTRGTTVTGRIVDTDGSALREANVRIDRAATDSGGGHGIRVIDGGGGEEGREAVSDGDGRFEIEGIAPGKYDIEVRRRGFAKRSVPGVEVEAERDEVDVGDVALEPGERIQGFVVDRDDRPVESARVFVKDSGPMMFLVGAGPGGQDVKPDATTDPSGWFAVEDLSPSDRYTLTVSRTGFVDGNVAAIGLPQAEPVRIVLSPSSDVGGIVVDGEGEPIPGAKVDLQRTRSMEMGRNVMQMMMMEGTSSDADGRFLFEDQEPGSISLGASASGYQEVKRDDIEVPQGEDLLDVEMRLPAGGILQGRVLAPDGRPALGARVRVVGDTEEMIMMPGPSVDGNGIYRIEGLAPGPASIAATSPDYPRIARDVDIEEGLNALDLEFTGGLRVSGRVVDESGKPVTDAMARLVPAGRVWGGPEARTGAGGSFEMPGVQAGDYRLWVDAEGYAPAQGDLHVTVADEPVDGLEVVLNAGGAITGRVIGVEAERMAKVHVRADGPTFAGGEGSGVDREGRYRIDHLDPGTYEIVATVADSGRQARVRATLEPGMEETVADLQFGGGITLSGRAVQADRPVAGATVYVGGVEVEHDGWSRTDQQGLFSVDGLEPGTYRVQLQSWETGMRYEETVELATSREITLEIPTAAVSGAVVDGADRQPLAGVRVTLESADETQRGFLPSHTATTDLDGRFLIANISDGGWRLSASKKGYTAKSLPVVVQHERDVDDLRISLDPTEGMILEARLPSGGPPSELTVAVLDSSGMALVGGSFATGENGRVRLSTVPPGEWRVLASAAGTATTELRAQAPGSVVPVLLEPACRLTVEVPALREAGQIATVRVIDGTGGSYRALGWNGSIQGEWRIAGGVHEFRSLPPGNWTVVVELPEGSSWSGVATTGPGLDARAILE